MEQNLEAVFENGVLRPLTQIALSEQQHVTLTVNDHVAIPATEELSEVVPMLLEANEPVSKVRPWRTPGVVAKTPRIELFVQTVEIRTADLPEWQPQINVTNKEN